MRFEEIILVGIFLIGFLSVGGFTVRSLRPWRHFAVCGVGATVGGIISYMIIDSFTDEFFQLGERTIAVIGLENVAAALPVNKDYLFAIGFLLAGMALGGCLFWFEYNRQTEKDNKTV